MDYIIVESKKGLDDACRYFSKQPVIGFDTETTELSERKGDLRLVQLSDGDKTVILDVFHMLRKENREGYSRKENFFLFESLKNLLENINVVKVIHYSQFELKWVKAVCNSDIVAMFDTYLASILINYDLTRHSLANVSREYLGVDLDKTEQKSDWSKWDLSKEQYDYAALDVYYSPKLREVMYQYLLNDGLLQAAKLDFESAPAISSAEQYGLNVNRKKYAKEIENLKVLLKKASKTLQEALRDTKPNLGIQQSMFDIPEKNYSDVLLSSHSQVAEALVAMGVPIAQKDEIEKIKEFERKGIPYAIGTGSKAIAPIAGSYPILSLLGDYRGVEKMVTAFGPSFLEHLVKHPDGSERVHTTFKITGAPTGRMAAGDPNVQQVPDKTLRVGDEEYELGIREAFDFIDGRIGVNADYSQIELRIAAYFSRCPIFCGAFREKKDLHALTASLIFEVPYECCADENHEYYKKYRKKAKSINFGIVYGIGPQGLAAQLRISVDEAREIIDKHRKSHPVLWQYLDKQAKRAIDTLTARTASGRLQRFNRPTLDEKGFPNRKEVSAIGRNGKNMPIQGCLGGDSRILVQGKGYVKIGSTEKTFVEVWDGEDFQTANVTVSGIKELLKVRFEGGNSIECSPNHKFWARIKGKPFEWVEAKDLTSKHFVELTESTPLFDFFDYQSFEKLRYLDAKEIGSLLAVIKLFGEVNNSGVTISLPEEEYSVKKIVRDIFLKIGLTFREESVYYSKIKVKTKFSVGSSLLAENLIRLNSEEGFVEEFWTSKRLLLGYLQVIFHFAETSKLNLQIKAKKSDIKWLKDVQQALYLFKVSSNVITGLLKDTLYINDNDVYRYYLNLGVIEDKKVKHFFDEEGLKKYRYFVMKNEQLSLNVREVEITGEKVEMFDVVDSSSSTFMSNGLVTHNTSADILKRALKFLYDALKPYDANIVNIVHDEISVECAEEVKEEVRVILQKCMVEAAEEFIDKTVVPVKVDAKVIKNWSDK